MNPSIELISVSDQRKFAWINSRPDFDHSNIDMDKIGSMDLSLNSLCMLTFKIQSSIVFRDFLFSIRPIFPWAQSLRSAPLKRENLHISSEFWSGDSSIDAALKDIENGLPQDRARECLPMSLSTSYVVSMDFRTVCGLIKTIQEMDADLFEIYGTKFERAIENIPGYKNNSVKAFTSAYLISKDEIAFSNKKAEMGDLIYGQYTLPYYFAAQFLRQSNGIVKTDIWNHILDFGYIDSFQYRSQSSECDIVFYIRKSAYHKLMSLRSHWFADWAGPWSVMIGDYIKNMTINDFWDFIPNGNGKPDPYYRDMVSRVTGEEHNLPCPIMLEYPDLIRQRFKIEKGNPIIDMYAGLAMNGYINDNPDNKLRKQYLKMKGEL